MPITCKRLIHIKPNRMKRNAQSVSTSQLQGKRSFASVNSIASRNSWHAITGIPKRNFSAYSQSVSKRLGIDLSQPLKSKIVPGYLHRAYIGANANYAQIEEKYPGIYHEFQELCAVFVYQIASGDDVLSDKETYCLYKIQDLLGLPQENVDKIIEKYGEMDDIDAKWKEFTEKESFIKMGYLLGRETKYSHLTCVLLCGLEVASIDGLHEGLVVLISQMLYKSDKGNKQD
eukprot:1094585_1